jgi:hypothetical protein
MPRLAARRIRQVRKQSPDIPDFLLDCCQALGGLLPQ